MRYKQLLFIVGICCIGQLAFSQAYSHYENTEFSLLSAFSTSRGVNFTLPFVRFEWMR